MIKKKKKFRKPGKKKNKTMGKQTLLLLNFLCLALEAKLLPNMDLNICRGNIYIY